MNKDKEVFKLAEEHDGYIITKDLVKNNIRKETLKRLTENGEIEKVQRGVYIIPEIIPDEYKLIQLKISKGIYSFQTALYLWDLSNKVPEEYHITIYQGYNTKHLKEKYNKIKFHYVKKEILELGLTSKTSPFGNKIRVYNPERTICDLIKRKNKIDSQIFSDAITLYFKSKKKDLSKLSKYAEVLKVQEKLHQYTEVLL